MPKSSAGLRVIGDYVLERRLVCGGMAEIHRGRRYRADVAAEPVAVKLLLGHLRDDVRAVGLFRNETVLTRLAHHQHIVRYVDSGQQDQQPYLVMEYVDGWDMTSVFDRCHRLGTRLPDPVSLALASDLCDALAHVHELQQAGTPLGVVHRDVSPQNLRVTRTGVIKLLDFGLARAASLPDPVRAGALLGSVAYAAPEQLEGAGVDQRADLFSVGVLLFEWLTGKRLFWRGSQAATVLAVAEAEVPALQRLRPELPSELCQAVHRALARDPEARFATARELRAALCAVRAAQPGSVAEQLHALLGDSSRA